MTLRNESTEDVAYRLFRHIAAVERKAIDREEIRQGDAPASSEWILNTYLECLRQVERGQRREAVAPSDGATAIAAKPRASAVEPLRQLVMMNGADRSPRQPLDEWILDYRESDAYKERTKAISEAPSGVGSMPEEVALMCALIEHLRADLVVEIGSLFGQTSRHMAESVARNNGKLITIDPYGGHRMPGIVEGWPEAVRAATEFRPVFSMELFARIEEKRFSVEGPPKIGVAYVDGNHNFEYALFDVMEAADNLVPGGAIVIDNLEQLGPRFAVQQFLRMNPAWKLYYLGKIWSGLINPRDLDVPKNTEVAWGILIAPAHLQVAMKGRKFSGRLPRTEIIEGVRLHFRATPAAPVEMAVNLIYNGWPHDYHITGKGAVGLHRDATIAIGLGAETIDIAFDPPGRLPPHNPPVNLTYQLELTLLDEDACVLLDAESPFEFKFATSVD